MLAIRLRVRPCKARCSPRSVGRVTTICPSSSRTSISRAFCSASSPLGPLTVTCWGSMATVTPSGTGMGCFPIRLIGLPDLCHELAAHLGVARLVAGHHPAGGGDDGGAHAAQHLGHLARAHVAA